MENPFETIARRLSNIEDLLLDIKHRPSTNPVVSLVSRSQKVDFPTLKKEYYPGIPESTVRQDTAHLSRTKVGKRVLFDRTEVEAHLQKKRRTSAIETDYQVDTQFANYHQRRGGRKAS